MPGGVGRVRPRACAHSHETKLSRRAAVPEPAPASIRAGALRMTSPPRAYWRGLARPAFPWGPRRLRGVEPQARSYGRSPVGPTDAHRTSEVITRGEAVGSSARANRVPARRPRGHPPRPWRRRPGGSPAASGARRHRDANTMGSRGTWRTIPPATASDATLAICGDRSGRPGARPIGGRSWHRRPAPRACTTARGSGPRSCDPSGRPRSCAPGDRRRCRDGRSRGPSGPAPG